jgi:tetratricopeptide (TPR) repeat protein
LWGWFKQQGPNIKINLVLTDTRERHGQENASFVIKTSGKIAGFQQNLFSWLKDCGIENLGGMISKSLWQEDTSMPGLDFLGRALEYYYIYSSWGHEKELDMDLFNKAVSEAPHSYLAHDLRAWALYRKKDYQAAKKGFKSALKLNKNGLGALSGLMWCAIQTNGEKNAIHLGAEKSKIRMENTSIGKAYAAIRMGNIAYKGNDYARAVELYEKAVMWNPEKAAYLSKLALAYSRAGKFIRALDLLDHGLKIFNEQRDRERLLTSKADVFYNLSISLRKQGRCMEAISRLENALIIDKIYRLKKAVDDLKAIGSIFNRIGDHKRALENYKRSKEMEIKIDKSKR